MGGRGGRRRAPPAIAGGGRAPLAPPTYMLLVMPACTCACIHRGGGARRSRALPALALYRLPLATALSRSLASLTPAHLLTSARLPTSLLLLHSPTILSPALWEGRAICTARLSQIGEIYYGGNDFPRFRPPSPVLPSRKLNRNLILTGSGLLIFYSQIYTSRWDTRADETDRSRRRRNCGLPREAAAL